MLDLRRIVSICSLIMLGTLTSCAFVETAKGPIHLTPARFADLEGWSSDDHHETLAAFKISCEKNMLRKAPGTGIGRHLGDGYFLGGTALDWQEPCQSAILLSERETPVTKAEAKEFFEKWFAPWHVLSPTGRNGLFTGYFEPRLVGSRTKQRSYQTPILARPDDLVMVNLGDFRSDFEGRRIAGRVKQGRLYPYEDRAQIENGELPPESFDPIVWVDDPVDAFFLHIQGSGQVVLEDETVVRVGYAGQNGHPYYAIGRELVKRGALRRDNVSLESIQNWLRANPGHLKSVLNTNQSYVFFRELDIAGPIGAEGVPLTPGRSLAIDNTRIPYGVPVWIDTEPPVKEAFRVQRLMVAQDTGGAIKGTVRGDVFWGSGVLARQYAGEMQSEGQKWLLLPKTVEQRPIQK